MTDNDFLIGRGGNDTLNGGNGIDIAALPGDRSEYTFGIQGTAQFVSGPGGFDLTTSVELLQFNGADTVADAYQLGYGMTPINLTGFGLAGGLPIFGRGVADLLTMGTNANFRLIDLGVGVDTLTLGTANASYFLNLANVENLVGSSGNDTIGMTTSVGTSNMLVDGGFGNDTLVSPAATTSSVLRTSKPSPHSAARIRCFSCTTTARWVRALISAALATAWTGCIFRGPIPTIRCRQSSAT